MTLRSTARAIRDSAIAQSILNPTFQAIRRFGPRLPRTVYQHAIYRGAFTIDVPSGRPVRMIANGFLVENELFWQGLSSFEPESIGAWLTHARGARCVLDIGANTGLFGLLASAVSPQCDVHYFEPLKRVAAQTRSNVDLNSGRHTVHEIAVSDSDGSAALFDPGGEGCYSASLLAGFREARATVKVATARIDTLVSNGTLTEVDLVKIDVEGFEESVLDGMGATLEEQRPTILLEFLPGERRAGLVERIEHLRDRLGYSFFHLGEGAPSPSSQITPSPESNNVLLVRPKSFEKKR